MVRNSRWQKLSSASLRACSGAALDFRYRSSWRARCARAICTSLAGGLAGESQQVRFFNFLFQIAIGHAGDPLGKGAGVLDDEIIVHQRERLQRRHRVHAPVAIGLHDGGVEGLQEPQREVAPRQHVHAAPPDSCGLGVNRLTFPVVVRVQLLQAVSHQRALDGRPAQSPVQLAAGGHDGVAQGFCFQPAQVHAPQMPIFRVHFERQRAARRPLGRLAVGCGSHG